jgi:hypothetical protein
MCWPWGVLSCFMTAEHVDSIGRLYLYYLLYTYFHIKRQEIQSTLSLCTESGRVQSIGFFPSNDNRLEINHRLSLAVNITACEGHPLITRSLPDNPFHRALKVQLPAKSLCARPTFPLKLIISTLL